ncbi:GGDEF domain-containing protein [Ethanoligenens harbinense]|uniref:Diguanylate cyclase n=1 Tax=Ethanoligenens harbinense (strain DSM 18485 / JCM 12961 / CGMCC 1.5033 / YUAN-3) TaxID=663278 RepID=E6U8R5_ETHHY|nr:diguanylate cyclase [Ethanoligenens harbinense]ADU27150.1 diguanylate cyclase [Ethanoligenens harbinense YUAN-3]AVQ96222.1 sensor domain-containing diguanylate cyclase [Ethanoligenens harbinense YUAN-3]AYF38882.1 sensor domain-containing diguanylate cyclase [Ethanoligenens harbinense]AYF41632.1 sensor domain-containing diguanylate cyclase [Ethanoligenens harbinense]QCN92463.1 sensor domain-containing diguanylate cyclase [Ethanoligenens harbinense]
MDLLGYAEIDLFALAVLILVLLNLRRRDADTYDPQAGVFFYMVLASCALVLLDLAAWLVDRRPGDMARALNYAVNLVYMCATPFLGLLWGLYVDYEIYRDQRKTHRIMLPFLVIAVAILCVELSSPFTGWGFYVDAHNAYHRGLLAVGVILGYYGYLLYAFIAVLRHRRSLPKKAFTSMLVATLPLMLGGVFQSLFYGLPLVWPCITISLLIILFNIQNNQLYTDHLTGLYNRKHLEHYLSGWLKNRKGRGQLAGVMLDLNDFKKINDRWGHETGDRALVEAAAILKATFRRKDLICRYGGDEFIVILQVRDHQDMTRVVKRLKQTEMQARLDRTLPYNIRFSIGYDIFTPEMDIPRFIEHIDNLMYTDKRRAKMEQV